jgi:hypothetical protein
MSETLREKQTRFAQWVPRLIDKAFALGYLVTGGEWERDPRVAQLNCDSGAGIANSLHIEKLAIDLNLFRPDGSIITDNTGHKELGAWWIQQQPDFCWGGLFQRRDFDHYSLTPDGIRK